MPTLRVIKTASELKQEVPWRELSDSQYKFDPDSRTAVVSLQPGEALQVERFKDMQATSVVARFSIEEITITGANGMIKLQGEQVPKSFIAESKQLYTLTYR